VATFASDETPDSARLNSDDIRARYGECRIEVLEQRDTLRRVSLYTSHDGQKICRTYAVVRFVPQPPPELDAVHRRILAGESIGSALRSAGINVVRRSLYIDEVEVGAESPGIAALMGIGAPARLGVHAYGLYLRRDDYVTPYATIAEAHHPDYLGAAALAARFEPGAASPEQHARAHSLVALIG
jgi:hypothetical protein